LTANSKYWRRQSFVSRSYPGIIFLSFPRFVRFSPFSLEIIEIRVSRTTGNGHRQNHQRALQVIFGDFKCRNIVLFFKESLEICSKQHKIITITATLGCVKISRPTLMRYNFDKCGRIFIIFTIIFVRDL